MKLPASIDDVKTRDAAISHRWLPKPLQRSHEIDLASFHGEKPSLKLMPKYEKFSTVCHLTSCKKAKRIIEDGGLAQEKRRFYSPLANKSCEVNGVGFVANTENNLEELKSTRDENEGLQVKWMIGLHGDSGELLLSCSIVRGEGNIKTGQTLPPALPHPRETPEKISQTRAQCISLSKPFLTAFKM